MKAFFRTILFSLLSFLWCANTQAQHRKLDSVKVTIGGFNTETFVGLNCEAFESETVFTKNTKTFYKEYDLSKFKSLRKYLNPAKPYSMDIRGEILYYYGKTPVKYCFNTFGHFYMDDKIYYNKKLLTYIIDQFDAYHPKYLDTLRQP